MTPSDVLGVFDVDVESGTLTRLSTGTVPKTTDSDGYYVCKIGSKMYKVHRLLFLVANGYLPKIVDHVNGIKTDNRSCNLRAATPSQSQMNRKNTAEFRGVVPSGGKWRARIMVNKKFIDLGTFLNKEDAARAYDTGAKIHHGEFARLNFP